MKLCIDISKLNILTRRNMDTMISSVAIFSNLMTDGKTRFCCSEHVWRLKNNVRLHAQMSVNEAFFFLKHSDNILIKQMQVICKLFCKVLGRNTLNGTQNRESSIILACLLPPPVIMKLLRVVPTWSQRGRLTNALGIDEFNIIPNKSFIK